MTRATRTLAAAFALLASCRSCDADRVSDRDAGIDPGRQPPMPTGMLVPRPRADDVDLDASSLFADRDALRLTRTPPPSTGRLELRFAKAGERLTLLDAGPPDASSRFLTVGAFGLVDADMHCGDPLALPWRCDGADLDRMERELLAFAVALPSIDTLGAAKKKWPSSALIDDLGGDRAWRTARAILIETVRAIAGHVREARAKNVGLWMISADRYHHEVRSVLFPIAAIALALAACGDDDNTPLAGRPDASAPVPNLPGGWSPRASLPIAKQELAVVAVGDRVYVLGGLDGAGRSLSEVHVYDTKTDTWSLSAPLPEPLHHANAAVVDGRIYVAGALRGLAFAAAGVTLAYDPASNQWTPRQSMPPGTERGASFVAAIGTKIYVAGGLRDGSVADFSEYDTATDAWTSLTALPAARDHGMAASFDGLFFAIGGRSATIGGHTARVDVYDPAARAWSSRASMPTSRAGGAAAVAKGRIVVMSGEGDTRRTSGVFPETEAYDPKTDAWSSLPAMRTPRHGTNAATVGDVVFVPGGGIVQALGPSDAVEALTF